MAINLLLQVFYLCQEPLVHEYLKMTEKTTEKRRNFRTKNDCKVYKAKSKLLLAKHKRASGEAASRDKRGWQSSGPNPLL